MDRIPMTASGYKALEDEISHLKLVERPAVIKMITEARAHGDLSENAEYHAAKDRQAFIEGRVMDLEDKLSRADVIDVSKLSGKTVKFGAFVTLADEDTDAKVKYQIVGDLEADAKKGKISISSPIARALIGKSRGRYGRGLGPGRRTILRDPEGAIRLNSADPNCGASEDAGIEPIARPGSNGRHVHPLRSGIFVQSGRKPAGAWSGR